MFQVETPGRVNFNERETPESSRPTSGVDWSRLPGSGSGRPRAVFFIEITRSFLVTTSKNAPFVAMPGFLVAMPLLRS